MSIIGSASRQRSTTPSTISSGSPPRTSAASKLVPPMSIVMQSRRPCGASCHSPAVGPAAGPESSDSAARSEISAGVATPPLDCMISSVPAERELLEAAREGVQIARDDRPDVGVEHRRRRAVVVAHLRQQIARRRDVGAGHQLGDQVARAPLVRGLGGRVHERDRDRLDALRRERLDRGAHVVRRRAARARRPCSRSARRRAAAGSAGRAARAARGGCRRAPRACRRAARACRGSPRSRAVRCARRSRVSTAFVVTVVPCTISSSCGDEPLERQVELRGELGQAGHDAARRDRRACCSSCARAARSSPTSRKSVNVPPTSMPSR